ncbi:uncharacterized protein TRUGW13939_11742 [Talaromyces rugulosus]|uniref:Uncharacterized protein n=1 Tax=Talaromyces rugulosus TaxID=121627 RepID=A0A7H8REM2_TALRU|nr:uncharacterized protein TRUGW13939_11742 [Talaromyces rugulosus]QKX64567.1 hypothetical protein TRUGW13939_11742 [Talaromyces rugulosus]
MHIRVHWSVFVAVHPLFQKALPQTCRGSVHDVDVKLIRETLVSVSFVLPKIDLNYDLENPRHSAISTALVPLLEFLETLVKEEVLEMKHKAAISEEESDLFAKYPKLAILRSMVRCSESNMPLTTRLETYINYIDPENSGQNDLPQVAAMMNNLKDKFLSESLEALKAKLADAGNLKEHEIRFIERAGRLNSTTPPEKCSPPLKYTLRTGQQYGAANPKTMHLAFSNDHLSNGERFKPSIWQGPDLDSIPTLYDLLHPKRNDDDDTLTSKADSFVHEDQKFVEFLIAYSLLNLDASAWLGTDLDVQNIFILATPNLDRRWKPHVVCSLKNEVLSDKTYDVISSFGILLMEIEAKRSAGLGARNNGWETNLSPKDAMLNRIVQDWGREVDNRYINVATACLRFRELSETFYDPLLPERMNDIGTFYKYILAPLYRLVTQQHDKISLLCLRNFLTPSMHPSSPGRASPTNPLHFYLTTATNTTIGVALDIKNAETFMEAIKFFGTIIKKARNSSDSRRKKIRIAVIDTGIDDEDDILIKGARDSGRITNCRGFTTGNNGDYKDVNGHGTHVARLILQVAPEAEIVIAKVSDGSTMKPSEYRRIAHAITWAHREMNANIISMSFGIEYDSEVDEAIHAAYKDDIAMFAAASNSGGNRDRPYPSNRSNGVICVHASDGLGNNGGISPSPERKLHNFSTLGISVPSKWKGNDVLKSGTSFATPIAAALVANVLEFSSHICNPTEKQKSRLCAFTGARDILRLMAKERQEYDYVYPFHINWDEKEQEDIVRKLYKIARGQPI